MVYAEYQSQRESGVKSFAKFREIKYNNSKDFDLLRQYREQVSRGKVSAVGFEKYKAVTVEAHKKIVGVTTSTGETVQGIRQHLVDRIIGSEKEKRLGVSIEKVIETLQKGECDGKVKYNSKNQPSISFETDDAYVSFNPMTKEVIQCRPNHKRKRSKK